MFTTGGLLLIWDMRENAFEAGQVVLPIVAAGVGSIVSTVLFMVGDRLWISLPVSVVCLAMIGVMMA